MKLLRSENRLETHLARLSDRLKRIANRVRGVEIPFRDRGGAVPGDVDCVWGRGILRVRVDCWFCVGWRGLPFEGESAVVHHGAGAGEVCERGEEDRLVVPF